MKQDFRIVKKADDHFEVQKYDIIYTSPIDGECIFGWTLVEVFLTLPEAFGRRDYLKRVNSDNGEIVG